MRIVLLGDSIFDNAAYTDGDPAVADHLQKLLNGGDTVDLLALDGSVTRGVTAEQVPAIPPEATHLVVSSGGNDALQYEWVLSEPVENVAEALGVFREPLAQFERDYRTLLTALSETGKPVWCCTIYNGRLEPPMDKAAPVAIALYNDVITRVAREFSYSVIELRQVCTDPEDYANPIEPSGPGGAKIARAILAAISSENET